MTYERYLYVAQVYEEGIATRRVFMTFDEADAWVKQELNGALTRYAEAVSGALFDDKIITSTYPDEWDYASQAYGYRGTVQRAQSEVRVWLVNDDNACKICKSEKEAVELVETGDATQIYYDEIDGPHVVGDTIQEQA